MKFTRIAFVAAAVAAAISLSACDDKKAQSTQATPEPAKKVLQIGVVQLVEHDALDAANKGFVDGLKERGFKAGENVEYDFQNAQADQSNLRNIAQRFMSKKVDLIGAIATPAAQTVANATTTTPIVATAVTDFEIAKLIKSNQKPGTNVTGSSDMAPIDRLVELTLKFYPNAKKVGAIYSSSEINSQRQVAIFKEEAKKRGLEVQEATVSSVNDIQQAAQSLVGKVDYIYAPTDNTIASAVPALIKITEPAKIPVFTGEGGMVKSGATAAISLSYYELGKIAGNMAADILQKKSKPEDMAIRYQTEFKTLVNKSNIEKLGIKVPEGLSVELVE